MIPTDDKKYDFMTLSNPRLIDHQDLIIKKEAVYKQMLGKVF